MASGLGCTFGRLMGGILIYHHGMEHSLNGGLPGSDRDAVEQFAEYTLKPYFPFLPIFPLTTWTIARDYCEVVGASLLFIGFLTRPVAAVLTFIMTMAIYYHISADGWRAYSFEEPALFLCVYAFFTMNGAGPFSVDHLIVSNTVDPSGDAPKEN